MRNPATDAFYKELFDTIQKDGVVEFWRETPRRYLYPGDGSKYWAMTRHKWQSRAINRMCSLAFCLAFCAAWHGLARLCIRCTPRRI